MSEEDAKHESSRLSGRDEEEGGWEEEEKLSGQDIRNCFTLICRFRGASTVTVSFPESLGSAIYSGLVKGSFVEKMGLGFFAKILFIVVPALLAVALDLTMLSIGSAHASQHCDQPLSVWLVVSAGFSLAVLASSLLRRLLAYCIRLRGSTSKSVSGGATRMGGGDSDEEDEEEDAPSSPLDALLQVFVSIAPLFHLVWMVVGVAWVYAVPGSAVNDTSQSACNAQLYHFTFWYLTLMLVLHALIVWLWLLFMVMYCTNFGAPSIVRKLRSDLRQMRRRKNGARGHRDDGL